MDFFLWIFFFFWFSFFCIIFIFVSTGFSLTFFPFLLVLFCLLSFPFPAFLPFFLSFHFSVYLFLVHPLQWLFFNTMNFLSSLRGPTILPFSFLFHILSSNFSNFAFFHSPVPHSLHLYEDNYKFYEFLDKYYSCLYAIAVEYRAIVSRIPLFLLIDIFHSSIFGLF